MQRNVKELKKKFPQVSKGVQSSPTDTGITQVCLRCIKELKDVSKVPSSVPSGFRQVS